MQYIILNEWKITATTTNWIAKPWNWMYSLGEINAIGFSIFCWFLNTHTHEFRLFHFCVLRLSFSSSIQWNRTQFSSQIVHVFFSQLMTFYYIIYSMLQFSFIFLFLLFLSYFCCCCFCFLWIWWIVDLIFSVSTRTLNPLVILLEKTKCVNNSTIFTCSILNWLAICTWPHMQ